MTTDEEINAAIDLLRGHGYSVRYLKEREPETPLQIATRLGVAPQTVCRKLKHPECPVFDAWKGDTGRLVKLIATPELDRHIKGPLTRKVTNPSALRI